MKAAVFYGPRDLRLEEVDKPTIKEDEALIKVKFCGICGTDPHIYSGVFPIPNTPLYQVMNFQEKSSRSEKT